jgi:hypothetical protein
MYVVLEMKTYDMSRCRRRNKVSTRQHPLLRDSANSFHTQVATLFNNVVKFIVSAATPQPNPCTSPG